MNSFLHYITTENNMHWYIRFEFGKCNLIAMCADLDYDANNLAYNIELTNINNTSVTDIIHNSQEIEHNGEQCTCGNHH